MAWHSKTFLSWAGISAAVMALGGLTLAQKLRPAPPIVFEAVSPPIASGKTLAPPLAEKTVAAPVPNPEVVVHVAGAVKNPGVFHLPLDSRAQDAIQRAGGALPQGDLEQINLAAKCVDGSQLYVPVKGSAPKPVVAEPYQGGTLAPPTYSAKSSGPRSGSTKSGVRGGGAKSPAEVVSLSAASTEQLQTIPGIGPSTAEKIIAYRSEHGKFQTVDDLLNVSGIGAKRLEKMRKWLKP